jgi:hypothetical protein
MPTLHTEYIMLLGAFARLFSKRIWEHARILLIGAILSPAERTVTAALRVMGLSGEKHFQNFHRVLNRAVWSSLEASRILLGLLISAFASNGPIILGLDDTIERRRGAKIKAKGIYRDPVRSSHSHMVKASGLRWLSLMVLAPVPWAKRVWALPFLTVLAPSERYYKGKVRKHKKLTEWARQMALQTRRWLPKRLLVIVADSSFAVIDLLWQLRQLKNPICMIRSHAFVWMRLCMSQSKRSRANWVAHARRASACPRWRRSPKIKVPAGNVSRCKSGMERRNAILKSHPIRRSGFTAESQPCQFAGSSCVTRRRCSKRRPCYARIVRFRQNKSLLGSCVVGRWRLPFMKSVPIWALRPKGNGRISRSCALHPPCWGCFPS